MALGRVDSEVPKSNQRRPPDRGDGVSRLVSFFGHLLDLLSELVLSLPDPVDLVHLPPAQPDGEPHTQCHNYENDVHAMLERPVSVHRCHPLAPAVSSPSRSATVGKTDNQVWVSWKLVTQYQFDLVASRWPMYASTLARVRPDWPDESFQPRRTTPSSGRHTTSATR